MSQGEVTARVVFSALTAAAGAYAGNRFARSRLGRKAIIWVAPGLEESFKTGLALLFGAPVLACHVAFGLLEALFDFAVAPRPGPGRKDAAVPPAPGGRRAAAALAGLIGHTLFGALTVAIAGTLSGAGGFMTWPAWSAGAGSAFLVHVGWNALVMGKVKTTR